MFGNVNVDYQPCKTAVQLQKAADYMLGRLPEQIRDGVVKTAPNLYWGINCDRDNYSRDVLMTRNLFGKRPNGKNNLAFKMSISFSPDDNDKLTYDEVFRIAKEFADKHFQGYEVLFAVHTDKPHKHVHFLVGNCHIETGRAYRRNQRDLYDMCEFFGEQCMKRGLTNSIRKDYFNDNPDRDKETFAERQMKAKGKETFKDELREVIQIELADPNNRTLEDVVNALMKHYHVECRVKGNTISYRHPNFTDKSGKLVSVRGSKLGDKYTVKGIKYELTKIWRGQEADRAEVLTADNTRTTNQSQERGMGILLTGETPQRGGKVETEEQQSAFITGSAEGIRTGGNSGTDADTSTGNRQHQGEGTSTVRSIGGEHSERQSGRESSSDGVSSSGDVRSFEELFREYEQRNGTSERKRPAKPEPARAVRKKRQDRGL
ncbi:MAG: relaxase/mobilization nuclease domain-containing protein [Ruminococcus sp.]|nr:relaxase/mobilization nuclease domain-containing protein [Ruminococcus sp.]